jgi:hypothetical protein
MIDFFIYANYNLFADFEREGDDSMPIEFITLKNNSERLVIRFLGRHKLVDPYQVYDEIYTGSDFNEKNVITKLNKKIFIDNNGYVCVENGLYDNLYQQLSHNTIYRKSIYTLSTFKTIRSMLKEIIKQKDIEKFVTSERIVLKDKGNEITLSNYYHFHPEKVNSKTNSTYDDNISISGVGEHKFPHILSLKLLNNQDLVLVNMKGIDIYTINEDGFKRRYFWHNNNWKIIYKIFRINHGDNYDKNFINEYYKRLIETILESDFDDLKHSIPLSKFIEESDKVNDRKEIVEDVIHDSLVSSKFRIEMLGIAIKEKYEDVVKHIINNAIKSIQENSVNSENYMAIISLNLTELCDNYPDFIIKYISCTSIILSPYCNAIRNSTNTSLHSYTQNIYIKESNMDNTVFKSISALYKGLIQRLRIEEEIQTVSFIVPLSQICVYKDDSKINDSNDSIDNDLIHYYEPENNQSKIIIILRKMNIVLKIMISGLIIRLKIITRLKKIMMIPNSNCIWNEFLYKQKSILFCNIDSNNFYKWWNFAAIIDYKWKTFGRVYYYLIWLFYTIFYVCYSLASTLEQKSIPDFYFELLFIISIIFGSIFLIFEIRYFLWDYKRYFNDIWNLFGK